jgi:hypothetical protein
MIDNLPQEKTEPQNCVIKQEVVSHVTLRKSEVIEILKSLEGLKKKLEPLLKA